MPPGPLGRSIANETATCLPHTRPRERRESVQASEHLAGLNEAQRAAVEHGSGDRSGDCRPLLVIAGAGSGKTKTLAHRVANLIVHGADPRRILLLTFSRRAAAELIRRAERVANIALASTRVAVPNSASGGSVWCRSIPCERETALGVKPGLAAVRAALFVRVFRAAVTKTREDGPKL